MLDINFHQLTINSNQIQEYFESVIPDVTVVFGAFLEQKPGSFAVDWKLSMPDTDKTLLVFFNDHVNFSNDCTQSIEIKKYKEKYNQEIHFFTMEHNIPGTNTFNYFMIFEIAALINQEYDAVTPHQEQEFIFTCLNRGRRNHRTYLMNNYVHHHHSRIASYQASGLELPFDNISFNDYNNMNLNNTNIMTNKGSINSENFYNNTIKAYKKAQFSIVTETGFDSLYPLISEKTLHPIMALHPALYAASKGNVQILRELGLDVFDDIFDHSYDTVNGNERIDRMWNDNIDVITNGIDLEPLWPRLLNNRELLLNKIPYDMTDELFRTLTDIFNL